MPDSDSKPPQVRVISRDSKKANFIVIGQKRLWFNDIYARLISAPWSALFAAALALYLAVNTIFACAYFATDGIENAKPGSFSDAFFFSVQTMATIGYGKLVPVGILANILVTIEAFFGFGYFAVVTGLMFAKFSRPTARIMFSKVAVVHERDGKLHFMCRMANERLNRVVNVTISMVVLLNETGPDGKYARRFHDMKLVRANAPFVQLSWLATHIIDEQSPIHGMNQDDLRQREAEIIISLTGLDETLSQTIHARQSYIVEEIYFDHTFVDVLNRENGRVRLDYRRFHDVEPMAIVENASGA